MPRTWTTLSAAAVPILFTFCALVDAGVAQGVEPYPQAVTDRLIHQETPMSPPPVNVVFTDPDFHSQMVRATDPTTNFRLPDTFLRTEGDGMGNEWSADDSKFYVLGKGGQLLAFAFDPATMAINPLPNAGGRGLLLPMRQGTFSFVDPDLIYGTTNRDPLTIKSYRFSTGVSTPVIDTRTCGVQPPLGTGPSVVSDDDVSLSLDDSRISISEGGPQFGKDMFVVVYDKALGCRWYNTQTGQIGGQWGATGHASVATPYLVRHAHLSRDGKYAVISVNWFGWYVWDLSTLNVTACAEASKLECDGYGALGYSTKINGPGVLGDMQTVKRPLNNLSQFTQLYYPLPSPGNWGQSQHFSWNNIDVNDSAPICGSTYSYDGDPGIDQPYAGEIFCIETDGQASTIWRFAHNRATYISPFFQTQPSGTVSRDGRFFMFTSDWDAQLGLGSDGKPRSDVFIVKLE
ncbi:MAG TPA: hypothetical protein VFA67_08530 [Candidatus Sulfotelmatobacter sp.]|nr:hypothetical protein [Candidatus Sulfotelmatobacter sp.]